MERHEHAEIEKKWKERWSSGKIFESNPDKRKKFYITVAYPYPSGGMHVGHIRTYTVVDVMARFKRMQGFNVLFPMAWHVTGTPIVGAVKRLKDKEQKQMYVLKQVFGISDEELERMRDPMGYARHFIDSHYRKGMDSLGFTVDWRRQYTTNDSHYNKFVEWQYSKLKEAGLIKKGLHPVKWCDKCGNPVTTHDLLEGEDADINDFTLVKFRMGRYFLPAATLRPETVYGVTNMWVNPSSNLVVANVDGEDWMVSEEAALKLGFQDRKVEIIRKLKGSEIVGKEAVNPVTGHKVLILPADFVNPDNATGIVMSVPSHAPFDYVALRDIRKDKGLKKYGIDMKDIEKIKPIPLIHVPGMGEHPAIEAVEGSDVKGQGEMEKIEAITKEIYKKEFHTGTLNDVYGKYKGKKVSEIKAIMKRDFGKKGVFGEMLDFSKKVVCRCGGRVYVAKKSSYFLTYGDKGWKDKAKNMLKGMDIIQENVRLEYEKTIDWLEDWPCVRNFGMGTHLPWDKNFMIDPLSDSTIYMSFYTISHLARKYDPTQLVPELFDYVFLGKGSLSKLEGLSHISRAEIEEMKRSFDYWYPLDWRCSAIELVQNHLTFFIFHHAEIFPKDKLPKGIATWGMGLLEGGKMSSSKGNVVLANDAISQYGADATRLFLFSSVEPWQDFDWRAREVENYKGRLQSFYKKVIELIGQGIDDDEMLIDKWMLSQLNRVVQNTTEALEGFQTRKASLECFFRMNDILRWYERRAIKKNKKVIAEFLNTWVRLMTPFIPFTCEELWERLGNEPFISNSLWPKWDEKRIDLKVEMMEDLVKQTTEDIGGIIKLLNMKPGKIHIYVSPMWKYEIYRTIMKKIKDPANVIQEIMKVPEIRKEGKHAITYAEKIRKEFGRLKEMGGPEDEYIVLFDARKFLEKEFGCEVKVFRSSESQSDKARKAEPGKPGIEIF